MTCSSFKWSGRKDMTRSVHHNRKSEMNMVKVEVAEFTDKVTGKVTEYHYVSKADYDAISAEMMDERKLHEREEAAWMARVRELEALINNPHTDDFLEAV